MKNNEYLKISIFQTQLVNTVLFHVYQKQCSLHESLWPKYVQSALRKVKQSK